MDLRSFNNIHYLYKDNIYLFENVLNYNVCNDLIKYINEKEKEGKTGTEKHGKSSNVQCSYIPIEKDSKYDKIIYSCINKYFTILQSMNMGLIIDKDSNYCLRRIYGNTRLHSDGEYGNLYHGITQKEIRTVSCIIALNSNYSGGYFEFPVQKISIKLKRGDLIIFPPYWTHPHKVSEPTNETSRYTINTWGTKLHNNLHINGMKS